MAKGEYYGSLKIDGKFLDEHTMGKLEDKIWEWLRAFGIDQGIMEEEGFYIEVILRRKYDE